jgi:hypothetical protein
MAAAIFNLAHLLLMSGFAAQTKRAPPRWTLWAFVAAAVAGFWR